MQIQTDKSPIMIIILLSSSSSSSSDASNVVWPSKCMYID